MTRNDIQATHAQQPSRSRMRHVETRLRADAEAVLREIAYVLKLTQQVKRDILSAQPTEADAGSVGYVNA
jgi:hypothetical protein